MASEKTKPIKAEDLFQQGFEGGTHRNVESVAAVKRIVSADFQTGNVALPDDETVRQFITDVCLNIAYYSNKLRWAMWKRRGYVAISIALIVAIPILVYGLPYWIPSGSAKSNASATDVMAQITVALTGILGLQKAIATWITQTQRYGRFWKALADLKELYYGLRTKWRGRAVKDGKIDSDFLADMRQAVQAARVIVRQEQDDFFNNLTLPTIDAPSILSAVSGAAGTLTASFKAPYVARQEAEEKDISTARRQVAQLEGELKAIDEQIKPIRERLGQTPAPENKAELEATVAELRKQYGTKRALLITARGALAAAGGMA